MFHRPSSLVRLLCALGWLGLGSPSLPAQAPVRLVAEKAQLASGEVTGLRFCFTTRPLENWKVSVDGEGGGSVRLARSGALFYRAPEVAATRTFNLRMTSADTPWKTVTTPVTVTPAAGAGPGALEALPSLGPATLLVDAMASGPELQDPLIFSKVFTALAYLARDLGCAKVALVQVLKAAGGSEAPNPRQDLAFSASPHQEVSWAQCVLAQTRREPADRSGRQGPLLVLTARPEQLLGELRAWTVATGRPLVLVDARQWLAERRGGPKLSRPGDLAALAQAWRAQDPAGLPLLFQLEDLPAFRAWCHGLQAWDGQGPDPLTAPGEPGLRRLLDAQVYQGEARAWAEAYLSHQADGVDWRHPGVLEWELPSGTYWPVTGPQGDTRPVLWTYLDWLSVKVAAEQIPNFISDIKAFLKDRPGLEPYQVRLKAFCPPDTNVQALARLRQANCEVAHNPKGKPEATAFALQAALSQDPRPAQGDRPADGVCLVASERNLGRPLTQLALDGHRTFLISGLAGPAHTWNWPPLFEDATTLAALPSLHDYLQKLDQGRRERKAEAVAVRYDQYVYDGELVAAPALWRQLGSVRDLCIVPGGGKIYFHNGTSLSQLLVATQESEVLFNPSLALEPGGAHPVAREALRIGALCRGPGGELYCTLNDGRVYRLDPAPPCAWSPVATHVNGPGPGLETCQALALGLDDRLWFSLAGGGLGFLDLGHADPQGVHEVWLAPAWAQLGRPTDLCLARDGALIACDEAQGRFLRILASGSGAPDWQIREICRWNRSDLGPPPAARSMVQDADGSIVFVDEASSSLRRLSRRTTVSPDPPQEGPWVLTRVESKIPLALASDSPARIRLRRDELSGAFFLATPWGIQAFRQPEARARTKPCTSFATGTCPHMYDPQRCQFRHDQADLGAEAEDATAFVQTEPDPQGPTANPDVASGDPGERPLLRSLRERREALRGQAHVLGQQLGLRPAATEAPAPLPEALRQALEARALCLTLPALERILDVDRKAPGEGSHFAPAYARQKAMATLLAQGLTEGEPIRQALPQGRALFLCHLGAVVGVWGKDSKTQPTSWLAVLTEEQVLPGGGKVQTVLHAYPEAPLF